MEAIPQIHPLIDALVRHPWFSLLITTVASAIAGTGIFSFLRRTQTPRKDGGAYFTEGKLLSPPMARPAYSDRMAYVLAEISDLAYYRFEGQSSFIDEAVKQAMKLELDREGNVRDFLEFFSKGLLSGRQLSVNFLKDVLRASDFELLTTINVAETQGLVCKRIAPGEPSYVVVAFRGTEKKISDWLTDADATPVVVDATKVHGGFQKAFQVKTNDSAKTAQDLVREIMDSDHTKGADGSRLPLFITGHSLGGALALLATRNVAPNVNGACYTFGAPRVANYEYFKDVKTPIYRVVNSSDVVPRVPPGAFITVFRGLARLLSWLTGFLPAVSALFGKIEAWLDKLHGYRHFGDLRYLTDVAAGRFANVKLLRNPPAIDQAIWAWKHVAASLFLPLHSHSMVIYRKKLTHIANDRNRKVA
jgi:triacylglycerol lipase